MNSDASTLRPMTLRQSTIMQLARGSFLGRLKVVSFVALILGGTSVFGASYEELRSAAVGKCQATDPSAYQSGLFFNPDGYRSYYVRSECFQSTAIRFRDETLCAQVRQRYSLLSSSWGYSAARCRQLVEEGAAADRNALDEMKRLYTSGAVRLRDFRLERNGNGRDFDIIPSFVGEYAHGYILHFEIIQTETGKQPALLHSSGFYLDGNSNIRIFVRQSDLRKGFPELSLNHPYTVRATLVLDVGNGGQSGQWSDAFIERVFPTRARTQLLDREVRF